VPTSTQTSTELVYRTLVDSALAGRRAWRNVKDLAWEAGVGEKLAYRAVDRPESIGAVTRHPGGGFSVTDPERVLVLLCAKRSLTDAVRTTRTAADDLIARTAEYAIGGSRAALHHLGGRNSIADHAQPIVYVPAGADLSHLPPADDVIVLTADPRSLRHWSVGYTSPAQTYTDLFAQPGWQASEFRRALWRSWFAVDDWSKVESR
jgi:hypothetical protein